MAREDCICTALRQAAQRVTDLYDRALAPSGLKVTMYRLLAIVEQQETPTITETARRMGLDRSTLGRNVRVLARQGLLSLAPGTDERTRALALTDAGRRALAAARPLWAGAQAEARALLGPGDADALLARLHALRDAAADAEAPSAAPRG